uniref:Uncharacterized protein n=1 Tax=Rhizophora mucronata TaxID=61149 RepID=A0A2P2L342_RHIMU
MSAKSEEGTCLCLHIR